MSLISPPGPKPNPDSKRNSDDWVNFSCFIRPGTRVRVHDAVHMLKSCGISTPDDQSEIVEEALNSWLCQMEPMLHQVLMSQSKKALQQPRFKN